MSFLKKTERRGAFRGLLIRWGRLLFLTLLIFNLCITLLRETTAGYRTLPEAFWYQMGEWLQEGILSGQNLFFLVAAGEKERMTDFFSYSQPLSARFRAEEEQVPVWESRLVSLKSSIIPEEETVALMAEENNALHREEEGEQEAFFPVEEKQMQYQWEQFREQEALIGEFYTVDSSTSAEAVLPSLEELQNMDFTLKEEGEGPQILIYHTHGSEAFADSTPGDDSTGILGAGEVLAGILQETYGYRVLHHTEKYDSVRDYAYSESLPGVTKVLEENPSIEVIIDLHRDAVAEGTKLMTQLNGKPTAKVMFFNGLSYSRQQGALAYLENPHIKENLGFSFRMQTLCNEYYPGFTRKIYLKAYRYNMHLRPKTLLVELGAQTNTVEEIHNALEPLAHVLDMVLRGEGEG